ncbi:MAG: 3-deoxy-manno-octulosonate cytidylyltransferase [Halothiobacillaceae bacterium]|jgi:3-deoxy-manno-octulosonate cytidylyltransferase (CMP-KDO synthetase)|nr:3-deoxy-manno-octulosonate cytidylyltransferase [Halothiobacillaceae bacterium]MDY0050286.1 3-deoxy-manno-octulosonate cytidylyltransferase [Halothiobacillaceae bacterium]
MSVFESENTVSHAYKLVIPARYGSSRLPGKPLALLAGKPMLWHVYQRALESAAEEVVIATDDLRIVMAAESFGATVVMTGENHPSGTDRLAEVVEQLGWDDATLVVNLQGDEPLMPASLLDQVAANLAAHPRAGMATLRTPIHEARDFSDPHVVKVVTDKDGYALYFSRAPIPWERDALSIEDNPHDECFRHLGIYAYRAAFLRGYPRLPPGPLESLEKLEQLRALWNGVLIHVDTAREVPGPGVDTPDDLARVEARLSARENPA